MTLEDKVNDIPSIESMRLRNLTRRREIGANSYLIETEDARLVIDSGMHPKGEGREGLPNLAALQQDSLDAIIVSHAHHDHIGSLPVLQRSQPRTPVYMTEFTGEVGSAMLHNSVNVMVKQRQELSIHEYPLFTHRELDGIRRMWSYVDLGRTFGIGDSDIDCTFYDAGHILGSTGVKLTQGGKSLFYTGDVCFESQTISLPADFPTEGIDVLIMETTRGDAVRRPDYTRRSEKERLGKLITETYAALGSVLIPVFALGKTQEVMLMLHELRQLDLIPDMPLFIGGLSTKITEICDRYADKMRRAYPGFRLMEDIDILVASRTKRREINYQARALYALSSGMMTEATTSNNFAHQFLDNPRNSLAFVGYTDPESPGHKVRHCKPGDKVQIDSKRPAIEVNARIESFDFSAHATRESIMEYVTKLKPKKVLLVHGDEPAQLWFTAQIQAALPGVEIVRPGPDEWVNLW
jgi:predicted metal-dependent RNase